MVLVIIFLSVYCIIFFKLMLWVVVVVVGAGLDAERDNRKLKNILLDGRLPHLVEHPISHL